MNGVDLQGVLQSVLDVGTGWGIRVVGALVLLVIGRMAAGWGRRLVRASLERAKTDATLVPFVSGLVYYLLLAVVLIAVFGLVGIQTASVVAILGAAGLAVGLAMQGTLSNFAAGVMLLVFRPFKIGDFIEAGGSAGAVNAIGLFTTTLDTPDNVRIIAPNSAVFGQTIKNYATNPTRRIDLVVGISYADDIGVAIQAITDVLQSDGRVLDDPALTVAVSELGDSSVNLVVRPWCKREHYWGLRFDLTRSFKETLEAKGCSIPFPQRDIHLFQASGSS